MLIINIIIFWYTIGIVRAIGKFFLETVAAKLNGSSISVFRPSS